MPDRRLDQAGALFKIAKDKTLSVDCRRGNLAPIPEPRQMRDGMSFPLHILQARAASSSRGRAPKNDMAELARIEAEPQANCPSLSQAADLLHHTDSCARTTPR